MSEYKTYPGVDAAARPVAVRPQDVVAVIAQAGITRMVIGSDPSAQVHTSATVENIWSDFDACWMRGPSMCFSPDHIVALLDQGDELLIMMPGGVELIMTGVAIEDFASNVANARISRKNQGFKA